MTSRNAWRRSVLVLALAGAALAPTEARAQSEAQKQQAKEHYEKGKRLYEIGKYNEAIEEYQKAYLVVDDPILLYNIAQSYRLGDKPDEAVRFYRNYLRRSPTAANRAEVEKKIADLEKLVEDRRRGTTPPVAPPTPPPVDNTAAPPPPPPTQVTPPPAPTAPPPTAVPPAGVLTTSPPPAEAPPAGRGKRIAAYSFLIGGGALVVTSIITGAAASAKAKALEKAASERSVFNPKTESDGKTLNVVALVTGGVGLAAGALGAILLFTGRSKEAPAASLFPVVGSDYAGAGARLTF